MNNASTQSPNVKLIWWSDIAESEKQVSAMSSSIAPKRSSAFYAGCDTPEKKKFRRERNTESVREYRRRKKELSQRRQSKINKNRNELLNLLSLDNCCTAIAEFEATTLTSAWSLSMRGYTTQVELLVRLIDLEATAIAIQPPPLSGKGFNWACQSNKNCLYSIVVSVEQYLFNQLQILGCFGFHNMTKLLLWEQDKDNVSWKDRHKIQIAFNPWSVKSHLIRINQNFVCTNELYKEMFRAVLYINILFVLLVKSFFLWM